MNSSFVFLPFLILSDRSIPMRWKNGWWDDLEGTWTYTANSRPLAVYYTMVQPIWYRLLGKERRWVWVHYGAAGGHIPTPCLAFWAGEPPSSSRITHFCTFSGFSSSYEILGNVSNTMVIPGFPNVNSFEHEVNNFSLPQVNCCKSEVDDLWFLKNTPVDRPRRLPSYI